MTHPTPFPDLDDLLRQLVSGIRDALGDDLVGVYLQGSFALGDADVRSDVDFIAVTAEDITPGQLAELQAMHARLHRLPNRWASHLEGSYLPRAGVRQCGPASRSFPYLDNGSDTLIADPHCDTHVMRWIVRERGITLTGPTPATLIDSVEPDELRDEMAEVLVGLLRYAREPSPVGRMSRWMQAFVVTTLCRILHTTATGTVAVQARGAGMGARPAPGRVARPRPEGDRRRPDPWRRVHEAADDATIDRTLAFADWVVSRDPIDRDLRVTAAPTRELDMHSCAVQGMLRFASQSLQECDDRMDRIAIDLGQRIAGIDRNIFGGFVEHLGRCVYGGVFEPGSPLARSDGLRTDVLEASRRLRYSNIRYPGGNFVSAYRWRDGVGPVDGSPGPLRSGMARDRSEHVRHQRVHGVLPGPRCRALLRGQCRRR